MFSEINNGLPSGEVVRAKYHKTHTCKGDSLRVNLYREKPRVFSFAVGYISPHRITVMIQRWRVVRNGITLGWIGKIPLVDNCLLRLYPKWKHRREWAIWHADNRTDKPNISPGQAYCVKNRRFAVECLVQLSHKKHRARLRWDNMWFSCSPPFYRRAAK